MRGAGRRIAESLDALHSVFKNATLRRIQLAFAGAVLGKYTLLVVLSIYAYHEGGVTAVALVSAARQAASAIVSPFAASIGDRFRRERVMLAADLGRLACMTAMAVLVSRGAPSVWVYAFAVLSPIVAAPFHSAEAALVTEAARSPQELTAANVGTSTFDSVGIFVGPAAGAFLISIQGYTAAFALTAALFAISTFNVLRLPATRPPAAPEEIEEGDGLGGLLGGFRAIAYEPRLRLLGGLYGAQCIVGGALAVLMVPMALRFLHTGTAGVGLLESAAGAGAIIGAAAALALVARARLGADFSLGLFLWGAPLLVVAALANPYVAAVALAVVGIGNSIVDIAAMTLLQRTAPQEAVARVFGVLDSAVTVSFLVGTLAAPVLVDAVGIRGALFCVGAVLPVLAALTLPRLNAVDRGALAPAEQLAALRSVSFLAPLPVQALEHLAARLRRVELPAGTTLFSRGDQGDSFYVLSAGTLAIDLPEGVKLDEAPGFVGEIALLRDIPRTASVRAETAVTLWALDRHDFLQAVIGHARASSRADTVVVRRLGTAPAA